MFKDRFLKPIVMKESFSTAVCNLLHGLLNVNVILFSLFSYIIIFLILKPEQRLGYAGTQEVKNHEFYVNIDWEKLYRKEI